MFTVQLCLIEKYAEITPKTINLRMDTYIVVMGFCLKRLMLGEEEKIVMVD